MPHNHKEKVDNYIARPANRSGKKFVLDLSAKTQQAKVDINETIRVIAIDLGRRDRQAASRGAASRRAGRC